jgi:uncharacterized protein
MKIGVLSDTHIGTLDTGMALAQKLMNGPFAEVEAILHAGDHVHPDLDSCFYPLPWYGVRGNMDRAQEALPTKRIVSFADRKIGMVHGWGSPHGIEGRVMDLFAGFSLDVLVFGHSHRPVCRKVGNILIFNPGSPTDRRAAPYHTVGILDLGTDVTGEIIRID